MNQENISVEEIEREASEIIPNRLYFTSFDEQPPESDEIYCFSIDDTLIYENFCLDFGPLNFGQTYRFCEHLNSILEDKDLKDKKIYFYSCTTREYCSNAAVLISAYSVLHLNKTAEEAFDSIQNRVETFENFHDASFFPCPYVLTVKDCLEGIAKAKTLNLFSWPNFDVSEYEHFCELENGDLNWLVEDKFLAFAGPFEERKHYGNGYYSSVPSDFINYFKEKNVTAVIRLNKSCYDAENFTKHGIRHYHLFYPDGGNPPEHILKEFIRICEAETGAIAVHCKAGLGRTGTCIGMYLMKHFDITANQVMGWFRVVRPGSIIGPQQDYLQRNEKRMKKEGNILKDKKMQTRKRESVQKEDGNRSFTEVNLSNSSDIYVNLKASKKSSSQFRLGVKDEGEAFSVINDNVETQGDVLNRLKAERQHRQ